MRRYIVCRGRKVIGGVEVTARTADLIRSNGFILIPA